MTQLLLTAWALAAPPAGGEAGPALFIQTASPLRAVVQARLACQRVFAALPPDISKALDRQTFGRLLRPGADNRDLRRAVNLSRPFAAYAYGRWRGGPLAVFLVPVRDRRKFLDLIKDAVKGDGPVYRLGETERGYPIFLRLADGYAYFALARADLLDDKNRLPPAAAIDPKDRSLLSVRLVPSRVGPFYRATLANALADLTAVEGGESLEADVLRGYASFGRRWSKCLLEQSRSVGLTVNTDRRAGELVVRAEATPRPGTAFAEAVAGLKPSRNQFAGLDGPDAAVAVFRSPALHVPEYRRLVGRALRLVRRDMAGQSTRDEEEAYFALMDALIKTAGSGRCDLALVAYGPAGGKSTALLAVGLRDGAKVEAALETWQRKLKPARRLPIDWHWKRVGAYNVHRFAPAGQDGLKELGLALGAAEDAKLHIAVGPQAAFVAFGAEPMAALRRAAAAPPGRLPRFLARADLTRVANRAEALVEKPVWRIRFLKKLGEARFVQFDVAGGRSLRAELRVNAGLLLWPHVERSSRDALPPAVLPGVPAAGGPLPGGPPVIPPPPGGTPPPPGGLPKKR